MHIRNIALALALVGCRGNWATHEDIADLQAQIDALSTQLADASTGNAADQARITELETQLADANARLDTLETSVGDILNDTGFTSFATRVGDVENALDAQDAAITDLETAQTATDASVSQLDAALAANNDVDANQDGAIAGAASDIAALATRTSAAETGITGLTSSLAGTNAAVASLTTRVSAAESDINTIEANVSSITGNVTTLTTDLTALKARVTTAEGTLGAHTTDLAALDARLDAADITLASHTSDLTTLDTRVDGHDSTLAAQGATLASHTSSLSTLSTALGSITTTVSTQGTTLTSQGSTLSGHTTSINTLNTTVGAQGTAIGTLNTTVGAQGSTLSGHTTTLTSLGTTVGGHTTSLASHDGRLTALEADVATAYDEIDLVRTSAAFRTVPRTVSYGNTEADSGALPGRTLTFVKQRSDTQVRVSWSDNRRNLGYSYGYWEILVNGQSCTNPGPMRFWHHSYTSGPSNYSDNHYNATITGYCGGIQGATTLPAGSYSLSITVNHQGGNNSDWYAGWNNTQYVLEVEEVF